MTHTASLRRHDSAEIDPSRTAPLPAGHPALSEGRTIYRATVTPSKESPRFLVSGHNNPKLGKAVTKGERKGWPIFHLALEERATCPRSCLQWDSCYGNSMPFSRRHTPDPDFERLLICEVTTLARQHPDGLLIRLHSLGDFYSVEYVYIWAALLAQFPQLHVFGYTAHLLDWEPGSESDKIARAINLLTENLWSRFAIRTSGGVYERSKTWVIDDLSEIGDDGADHLRGSIHCPAQTKATEACATCGLCWAEGARDRDIAFLRHGRKLATGQRGGTKPSPTAADLKQLDAINERLTSSGRSPVPGTKRPISYDAPPGPRAAQILAFLKAESSRQGTAADGLITISLAALAAGSGVPSGSLGFAVYELEKRCLVHVTPGRGKRKTVYRLSESERVTQGAERVQPVPVKAPKPRASGVRRGGEAIFAEANTPLLEEDHRDAFKARVVTIPVPVVPKRVTRFLMGDPPPGRTPWAAP